MLNSRSGYRNSSARALTVQIAPPGSPRPEGPQAPVKPWPTSSRGSSCRRVSIRRTQNIISLQVNPLHRFSHPRLFLPNINPLASTLLRQFSPLSGRRNDQPCRIGSSKRIHLLQFPFLPVVERVPQTVWEIHPVEGIASRSLRPQSSEIVSPPSPIPRGKILLKDSWTPARLRGGPTRFNLM